MKLFENKSVSDNMYDSVHEAFITNINHSLRTPLHIMLSMCDLIMQETDSEEISEYAANARRASKILQALMNKFYFYSRLRVGSVTPMEVQFPAPVAIKGFENSTKSECYKRHINFESQVSDDIPNILIGDNLMLTQILFNSTSLATRNESSTFLSHTVGWQAEDEKSGKLLITVSCDIGPSKSGSLDYDQVQYELSHIRKLTESMQGAMELKSVDNLKTLSFELPFQIAENQDYTDNVKEIPFTAERAKALLVDDNELNIHIINMLLRTTEISIDAVTSGSEALNLIKKNHYDIMFIDYMMPQMNGIDLLNAIKERYPEIYEKTPIFALTAAVNTEARDKLLHAGFKGFIPKPIEGNILAYIVKNNLPAELVEEKHGTSGSVILDEHEMEAYKDRLSNYDIYLMEGLKYTSFDITQYAVVAELIVKNYANSRAQMEAYFRQGDITDLGITAHSLKGNAKFIGAMALYHIAYGVEMKSEQGDKEFITYSMPLLYHEWEKMINGLKDFLDTYKKSGIFKSEASDKTSDEQIMDHDDYLEKIIDYIDDFQPEPAINMIDALLKRDITDDERMRLNEAKASLESFDYEDAIDVLKHKEIK